MQQRRIAILDCDSILYSIGNPIKLTDENGEYLKENNKFVYRDKTLEELVDSCEFIMNKILTNSNCTHYIGYIKGKNTIKAKRLIDPNYKADRNKEAPKWWNFVKGYLIENWAIIEANDLEVDDYVNITRLMLPEAFICAIDSDLLGLEGTHFNWRKNDLEGEWITTTKEQANYNFWSTMITGSHNNIKGIPGKGIKYVEKSFKALDRDVNYYTCVFNNYLDYFGEELGIEEFYKNYKLIKIPEKLDGFQLPELTEFKNKSLELSEEKGIFD